MNGLFDSVVQALAKMKANKNISEFPRPAEYNQSGAVVIWKSQAEMTRWLGMMHNGISIEYWRQTFVNLHRKPAPQIEPPDTFVLNRDGRAEDLNDLQIIELRADDKATCQICHQTGVAYIVRGLLVKNSVPQKLRTRPCWCQTPKQKQAANTHLPFKLAQ